MPFFISKANSAGNRLSSADTTISPAPTYVTYPAEALGQILETTDGSQIVQQPNKDSRIREWVWVGYRDNVAGYANLWNLLLSLRSRTLKQAGAQTPFVYLKEDVSKRLRRRKSYTGTATAAGASTLSDSGKSWTTNELAGFIVYIIDNLGAGQYANVVSNTATQMTISGTWTQTPNTTSKYEVVGWVDDWFKCRVIDVSRKLREEGTNPPIYDETKLRFVIEDSSYNDIG